jgi:hypothetical protein
MTTTDLSQADPRDPSSNTSSAFSVSSIFLLAAFGALITASIALRSPHWLIYGLPVLVLLAPPLKQSFQEGGSLGANLARDPHVFALASIIAMSGPVAAGTAYYLSGSFGLQEAAPAILKGAIASGAGMLALIYLAIASRRANISLPSAVLPLSLAPVFMGIFLAVSTPTADEELNAIFEPHFGLPYEAVRTAYLAYEIFPEPIFEANFGMSKADFLTAWVKIRADVPELQGLRLPGGDAI